MKQNEGWSPKSLPAQQLYELMLEPELAALELEKRSAHRWDQ